jgi:hypothetical protein
VFIDGNHVWPCPWRDAEIAQAHLERGGFIAMHDVTPNWPGVYRAALQLVAKGWKEVGRAGCLRVYRSGATAGACKVCGAAAGAECDHADHMAAAEVGFRL